MHSGHRGSVTGVGNLEESVRQGLQSEGENNQRFANTTDHDPNTIAENEVNHGSTASSANNRPKGIR